LKTRRSLKEGRRKPGIGRGTGTDDDAEVTYSYTWSTTNRIVKEAQRLGAGSAYTTEYALNSEGERTYLKYPDEYPNEYQIDYTSDDLHRVTKIEENSGGLDLVRYAYLGGYLSETILGDDAAVELYWGNTYDPMAVYDSFGRVFESTYVTGGYSYRTYMGASYDYASNVTQRYDGLRSQWTQNTFTYDNLHRLKKGQQGNPVTITWEWDDGQTGGEALDRLGNWVNFDNASTADARTHNLANEITGRTVAGNSRVISYDDAGNLLTLQDNSGTTGWRYTYDHRNRLVKVQDTADIDPEPPAEPNWNVKATYVYDGLNRAA